MASQMTSLTMFTQPFIQAQIKENINLPLRRARHAENVSIRWRHHVVQGMDSDTNVL